MALQEREQSFDEAWDGIADTAKKIMLAKRALRGTANISRQNVWGVVNRISEDKMERVKRAAETMWLRHAMKARGVDIATVEKIVGVVTTEDLMGMEDDLIDIANYCFIVITLLREKWELP